jgi:putative oxidoreductase
MVGAIAKVHWGHGLLAQNNGFELPLLIALVACLFIVRGGGPISIDGLVTSSLNGRRARRIAPAEAAAPA